MKATGSNGSQGRSISYLLCVIVLYLIYNRLYLVVDEGVALTDAERVAHGLKPYRGVVLLAGPGFLWLQGGLFRVFGASLLDAQVLPCGELAVLSTSLYLPPGAVAGRPRSEQPTSREAKLPLMRWTIKSAPEAIGAVNGEDVKDHLRMLGSVNDPNFDRPRQSIPGVYTVPGTPTNGNTVTAGQVFFTPDRIESYTAAVVNNCFKALKR
jgi:hypothetical protein